VEKIDLRIQKTKRNIYEALLILLEKKAFEEIKVSEICELALINRSTFYAHFEDKYALLDSLLQDLKKSLKEELEANLNYSESKEYYMKVIEILLNHVEEKKQFYKAIMRNNKNSIAMDMIYDTLKEDVRKHLANEKKNKINKLPIEFVSDFYLGAIFNVGIEWIRSNKEYQKEEIIKYLEILIPDNL